MVELSQYEKVSAPLGAIKQVLIGAAGDYPQTTTSSDVLYDDGEWVKSGQVYLQSDYPQLFNYLGYVNGSKLGPVPNSPGLVDKIVYENNINYYSSGSTWGTTDGESFTANPTTASFTDIINPGNIPTAPTYITHGLYENGVYLVGSYNNRKLHTSTDGINWSDITIPSTRYILNLKKSDGKYIAWLSDSRIWQSDDGINWTESYVGVDTNLYGDAAYGSGIYVAVQSGGNARTSTDFSTWSTQNLGNRNIDGVEFDLDNSRFIAVGVYGRIYYGNLYYGPIQVTGQIQLYTTPGSYSWTAPAGTTQVYVVCVGGGGGGHVYTSYSSGGGGGGLGWKILSVTPGQSYDVVVGAGGTASPSSSTSPAGDGGNSYFGSLSLVAGFGGQGGKYNAIASGGGYIGDGGGYGGNSPINTSAYASGGGGAGGYSGNGGDGGNYNVAGSNGSGGGGGGGGGSGSADASGAGGGVGILGEGASGVGGLGSTANAQPGTGGSGGSDGSASPGSTARPSTGGNYGGGGGASDGVPGENGPGGGGAVAILSYYQPSAINGDTALSVTWKTGPFESTNIRPFYAALGGEGTNGISAAETYEILSQDYPNPEFTVYDAVNSTNRCGVKGRDYYVYAGDAGKVLYSSNNKSWNVYSGLTRNITTVSYSPDNNLYIFGGSSVSNQSIYTTTDFVTVNSVSTTTVPTYTVYSVAYGNGIYVAGMYLGYLAISTDGATSFAAPSTPRPYTNTIYSITYGNGKFVGVSRYGYHISSTDGNNWNSYRPVTSTLYSIAYGNGIWVTAGPTGFVYTSKNAEVYGRNEYTNFTTNYWNVNYDSDNSQFLLSGDNHRLMISDDGIIWDNVSQHDVLNTTAYKNRMKILNGLYVINSNGQYYTSTNSFRWRRVIYPKNVVSTETSYYVYTSMPSYNGEYYIIPTDGAAILTPDFKKFNLHSSEVWKSSNSIQGRFILSQDSDQSIVQASNGYLYSLDTTSTESLYQRDAFNYNNGKPGLSPQGIDIENGVYLLYNISGALSTSTDNSTWNERFIDINESLYEIKYGNGIYVARGTNSILTSTDLSTWVSNGIGKTNGISISSFNGSGYIFDNAGNLYKYNPLNPLKPDHHCDVFADDKIRVTVVNNKMFAWSSDRDMTIFTDDGEFWERVPSQIDFPTSLCYGNGTYVMGAGDNRVYTSVDGKAWYPFSTSFTANHSVSGVAYGNNTFVAISASNQLSSSSNGEDWTVNTTTGNTSNLNDVIFAASKFVAVGQSGRVMTSSDGLSWDLYTTGGTQHNLRIKYLNNQFWICTGTDVIYRSSNGITWTAVTVKGAIEDIEYFDNKYYIVGDNGLTGYSTDGVNWTTSLSLPGVINSDISLEYSSADGIFVTSGLEGGVYSIYTSTDGVNWNKKTVPTTSPITKIIYENGLYVYGTTGGELVTSSDGNVWTLQTISTTGSITGITYGSNNYVYVTNSSQYGYSSNGANWLKEDLPDTYTDVTYLPDQQKFLFSSTGLTSYSVSIGGYSYAGSYNVNTEFYVPKVTLQTPTESFGISNTIGKQYIAALTGSAVVVYEWDPVSGFGQRFSSSGFTPLTNNQGLGSGLLAVSPSGRTIFCFSSNTLYALEFGENGFTGNNWTHAASSPGGVSISPDGTTVAFQEYALNNTLKAIDFTEGVGFAAARYAIPPARPSDGGTGAPRGTIWHPSGNWIAEANTGAYRILAISFSKTAGFGTSWGTQSAQYAIGASVSGMVWDPDGTKLHTVSWENVGRNYGYLNFSNGNFPSYSSLRSDTNIPKFDIARSPTGAIALAEDGQYASFRVWPSTVGNAGGSVFFNPGITTRPANTDVYSTAFSPDGSAVFAAWSSTIEAWSWFDADGFGSRFALPTVAPGNTVYALKSFTLSGTASSSNSYISQPTYETYIKAGL